MKRLSFLFPFTGPSRFAAAIVLAAFAVIAPSTAMSSDAQASALGMTLMPALVADATTRATRTASSPTDAGKDSAETVETHIRHLHDQLKITAGQEGQWKKVADVMRDNADRITSLAKARSEHAASMTAVDDLKSYAEITEAHETGVAKLLPVFTTLYNDMSDAQKKAADTEFREHHHRHAM